MSHRPTWSRRRQATITDRFRPNRGNHAHACSCPCEKALKSVSGQDHAVEQEVTSRAEKNEQMPDLVVSEDSGPGVRALEGIDQSTDGVGDNRRGRISGLPVHHPPPLSRALRPHAQRRERSEASVVRECNVRSRGARSVMCPQKWQGRRARGGAKVTWSCAADS